MIETAIVTETVTGTGIVTERAEVATPAMTGGTTEERTDATTEGMIGAMIGGEMTVDVPVPATGGTASPRHPKIPPNSQSRPLRLRTRSSKQRGQNWKHGKKRERLKRPWGKPRLKLWHLQEGLLLKVGRIGPIAGYCDFIT
jgi:hypothetical protein